MELPIIIATSVIRLANSSEAHGKIYLLDLNRNELLIEKSWDDTNIDYSGRGGERGLRGIAFFKDNILIASANRLLLFDRDLNLVNEFQNPYLEDIHEICVWGRDLYITSTKYDSVLVFELEKQVFNKGYKISNRQHKRIQPALAGRLIQKYTPWYRIVRPSYCKDIRTTSFEPQIHGAINPSDYLHLNSVSCNEDGIFFSGSKLNSLFRLRNEEISPIAPIPFNTHNARMINRDGIIFNYTMGDSIVISTKQGHINRKISIPFYQNRDLVNNPRKSKEARQGWLRGLAIHQGKVLIAGFSPATIVAYNLEESRFMLQKNLSMDIRNAIHGLEIYPF